MIILFLVSCLFHKTTLTGVIDIAGFESCAVELSTGEIVIIKSDACDKLTEGDLVQFYMRKK